MSNCNEFKCEQRSANIFQKLQNFYLNRDRFDTIIIAGSDCVNIRAHSIVPLASSDYFLEKFRRSLSKANIIELKNIEATTLQTIVNFMYTGFILLSLENVESLLRVATVLVIPDLINVCVEFISQHITNSNCLKWIRFSNEICHLKLKNKSLSVAYDNFDKLLKSKELQQLTEEELSDLLFEHPYGEFVVEDVFLALVAWIEYDKTNRQVHSFKLLSKIHYKYLTPEMIVENRSSTCKTVECYELICSWLQWHLSPHTRLIEQDNCQLALVTDLSCESLLIQTYSPHLDAWSVDVRCPRFKNKPGCSRIVIDGKLIIIGGLRGSSNKTPGSEDCLFLNSLKWNSIPQLEHERVEIQLVNLEGRLGVFGGKVDQHSDMDMIHIYDFKQRMWTQIAAHIKPSKFSKIVAHNGVLYIVDFYCGVLQSYHLSSDRWTQIAIPKGELQNFGIAAVGKFLYVIGGFDMDKRKLVSTVKRYSLTKNTWCEVAPFPRENMCLANVASIKNKIVVCAAEGDYADLVAEYAPDTNTWITLSQDMLKTPNSNTVICAISI